MEQDIYLYPGSQSEAHRLGEAALWDASFHANVSCARDIEAVIRVYGDGRSALKPEASQMVRNGGASSGPISSWPTR